MKAKKYQGTEDTSELVTLSKTATSQFNLTLYWIFPALQLLLFIVLKQYWSLFSYAGILGQPKISLVSESFLNKNVSVIFFNQQI